MKKTIEFIMKLFVVYSLAWILFMLYLLFNHINFPLNLEAMELTVLQHVQRIVVGQSIYVEASPAFVPLAYNPLFYYLSVPFVWVFGAHLFTLRLVAILGMLGSAVIIFLVIKKYTGSNSWAILAVGFFASAYRVMDTYLDNAHSDSWLLFTVLMGCYLIDINRSRKNNVLGVLFLITSFWFKQHGAIFAIGGVVYLTLRDGFRASWLYWILAALLGPGLYALMPAALLGPQFHYYTLVVPGHWSEFNISAFKRYLGYIARNYFVLAGIGGVGSAYYMVKNLKSVNIWFFMLPFALASGFLGALDPGSNNNVFIVMGVWFIVVGVMCIYTLMVDHATKKGAIALLAGIGVSYLLFFYNPVTVIVSPKAPEAYADLVNYLNSLDGTVYAPQLGQLESDYSFSPSVHWVPMEDLIRGPGVNEYDNPTISRLLDSALHPKGTAYILTNYPLESDPLLSFLLSKYHLEEDLGDRFAPLTTLPKRFTLGYPRYLYRFQ